MHLSILILHQDAHWFASATGIQIRYNWGIGKIAGKRPDFLRFFFRQPSINVNLWQSILITVISFGSGGRPALIMNLREMVRSAVVRKYAILGIFPHTSEPK